jgi:hypothetical protein
MIPPIFNLHALQTVVLSLNITLLKPEIAVDGCSIVIAVSKLSSGRFFGISVIVIAWTCLA